MNKRDKFSTASDSRGFRVLFLALNSKFIHSNLALHSMRQYYMRHGRHAQSAVTIEEYTINHDLDKVLQQVVRGGYACILASAYIWNIGPLATLLENFKKVCPDVPVLLGGPEVSYTQRDALTDMPYVDGIIYGEGERTVTELIDALAAAHMGQCLRQTTLPAPDVRVAEAAVSLRGMAYRDGGAVRITEPQVPINPLDEIPFAYTAERLHGDLSNRILYYESSRGCPFNCTYCLSSAEKGVRYLSLERAYSDLDFFLEQRVPQVKFVDRTFNANRQHALGIITYLIEHDNGVTNFHFEVTASLLDEGYYEAFRRARPGQFQLEMGIQSTMPEAMTAIHRPIAFDAVERACKALLAIEGLHVHVDLIAGLPFESFERFLQSFNTVYRLGAHQLQLGFLKLIKGTPLYREAERYGYVVRGNAPYEVLGNATLSYEELSLLKDMEAMLELYSNSGRFRHALAYIFVHSACDPASFFRSLAHYFTQRGYTQTPPSTYALYEILYDWYVEQYGADGALWDLLKVDFYGSGLTGGQSIFRQAQMKGIKQRKSALLEDVTFMYQYFPGGVTEVDVRELELITVAHDVVALIESGYETCVAQEALVLIDRSKYMPRVIRVGREETA